MGPTVNQGVNKHGARLAPTSSCLHPLSTEVTGVFERAWLFTWMLGFAHSQRTCRGSDLIHRTSPGSGDYFKKTLVGTECGMMSLGVGVGLRKC